MPDFQGDTGSVELIARSGLDVLRPQCGDGAVLEYLAVVYLQTLSRACLTNGVEHLTERSRLALCKA